MKKTRRVTDFHERELREKEEFMIEIEKLKYKDFEQWNVVE